MTPFDPVDFPPEASHQAIGAEMTGPSTFTAAIALQEWIRDLIAGGFTEPQRELRPFAAEQRAFQVTDRAGLLLARAEYGSYWPTRTMLAPCRDEGWWVSCPGLIPAAAILAAAASFRHAGPAAPARLEAAGWLRSTGRQDPNDPEPVSTWSLPNASRAAIRMDSGPDRGWLIYREAVASGRVISAALTTPPGVIAALALTD